MEKISFKPTNRSIMSAHGKWYLMVLLDWLAPEAQLKGGAEALATTTASAEQNDQHRLVIQAIQDLREALETAEQAVAQGKIELARPAAYFAQAAASLLIYATEDEE